MKSSGSKLGKEKTAIDWGNELLASVVVFLVALPLCMGIAIASGVPPALGLITGIVGGLVVGFLAGSPLQVSGPAAGLAVLVLDYVKEFGVENLGWVVLAAGLIQLLFGSLKLGRWFRAVSPAVIQGMLAGIGALIFASQFHVMVDDKPRGSGLENYATLWESVKKGLFPIDGSTHHLAAYVGVASILTIILWNKFKPKKLKAVPGPLLAVIVGTALAAIFSMDIVRVKIEGNLLDSMNAPNFSDFSLLATVGFWTTAFGFAIIASAETLLCATAVDRMHSGERTKYNKELVAQGVGNTICGFLGALPMTGVIVRSSANVDAGAKTRYSAIAHGAWLLLFVAILPSVIQLIPRSVLAAILVYTGYKLVNPAAIKKLAAAGWMEVVIYVVTLVMIVATNLLAGVLIGFGLALLRLLFTFLKLDVKKHVRRNGQVEIGLKGAATFLKLPKLAEVLESIPDDAEVHFHMGSLAYLDHAIIELIGDWKDRRTGKVVMEMDVWKARSKSPGLVLPEVDLTVDEDKPIDAAGVTKEALR